MRYIPKHITKDLLNKLYLEQNKSCVQVGKEINKSGTQVFRYLKRFGIKTRSACITKSQKGKILSQKTKDLIRQAHLGKSISQTQREQHRQWMLLNVKRGENNPNWKGGIYINPKGYRYIRILNHPMALSNGYVAEHRYVVSTSLGRPLTRFEHIHHLNGIKSDNRLENLELLNAQTHSLITRMESRIRELEKENQALRLSLSNEK